MGHFCPPESDPNSESGSGSTDPIESGSNPDTDPQPWSEAWIRGSRSGSGSTPKCHGSATLEETHNRQCKMTSSKKNWPVKKLCSRCLSVRGREPHRYDVSFANRQHAVLTQSALYIYQRKSCVWSFPSVCQCLSPPRPQRCPGPRHIHSCICRKTLISYR